MRRLTFDLTRELLSKPESGMGYQLVEAIMADDRTKRGIVYNADLLLFDDEPREKLRAETYARLIEMAESSAGAIKAVRVLPRSSEIRSPAVVKESSPSGRRPQPAKEAPEEARLPSTIDKIVGWRSAR